MSETSITEYISLANNDISGAATQLSESIQQCAKETGMISDKRIRYESVSQPWYDEECKIMKRNKFSLLNQFREM